MAFSSAGDPVRRKGRGLSPAGGQDTKINVVAGRQQIHFESWKLNRNCDTHESYESRLSSSLEGLNKSLTRWELDLIKMHLVNNSGEQLLLYVTQVRNQFPPWAQLPISRLHFSSTLLTVWAIWTPTGHRRLTLLIKTAAFPALSNTERPRLRQSCLWGQMSGKTRKYPARCTSTRSQANGPGLWETPPSELATELSPLISFIFFL